MSPWLAIVGLGEDGLEALSPVARQLIDRAEVLVGGDRHLAMLPEDARERLTWPSPLKALVDEIAGRRGQRVCVLATGDPLWYGVGVTLARRIPAEEITIVPSPSAFSLACARLGWPLAEVETLTLHGRPLELILPLVQPGARLLALSDSRETPDRVAALLRDHGYGASRLTVLEHMAGAAERRLDGTAETWAHGDLADFNTLAVVCEAAADTPLLARTPGLPDTAFRHDGQLTKREVRAATLARLAPIGGQLLWDVGAGCGSIGIEWLRAARGTRAVAIERAADRCGLIAANAAALGTPQLEVVEAAAPEALEGLAPPDAVFVGGGLSREGMIEACWQALKRGGRLVANAVTAEGEGLLADWHAAHGGELLRIAVSRAEPVGGFRGWKPLMPVTQYAGTKR